MTDTTPPIPNKLVYSVDEAAELLSIGRTTAFQLIADGRLTSFKIGHRRLVAYQDIESFIVTNRELAS